MDLSGEWRLRDEAGTLEVPFSLPGDGVTALHHAGAIPDPYWGRNEYDLRWICERDWVASRSFTHDGTPCDLVIEGLDTVAEVPLYDQPWFWRAVRIAASVLALGLAVGIGVPVFYVLDKQVRSEFEQLTWQEPTRVYARPLLLKPGLRLDAATLELELAAAGYRKDGGGDVPGTYLRDGGRFRIGTRAFLAKFGSTKRLRVYVFAVPFAAVVATIGISATAISNVICYIPSYVRI
mgnify:CR=1 FL=1